jgi:hypothetical protein
MVMIRRNWLIFAAESVKILKDGSFVHYHIHHAMLRQGIGSAQLGSDQCRNETPYA